MLSSISSQRKEAKTGVMYDDLKIVIKSILDESNEQINALNAQLKSIATKLEPLKLKIDAEIDESIRNVVQNIKELQRLARTSIQVDAGQAVSETEKITRVTTVFSESTQQMIKRVTEYQESLIKTRQEIEKYKDGKLKDILTVETTNWEKQAKAQQEVEKNIRSLLTRIELLKREYNLGDFSQLDAFVEKLDLSKIDLSNYKQQLDALKNEYRLIADAVQRTHRENKARLEEEAKLQEQKNATFMRNWVRQLEIDTEMRRIESERIKQQMQSNALEEQRIQKLEKQIELFRKRYQLEVAKLQRDYEGLYDERAIADFVNEIQNLSVSTPDVDYKMKQLALRFTEIKTAAQTSARALDLSNRKAISLGQAFETALSKFAIWIGASTVFYQTLRFFQHGIEYVNELNKALTEISIVTGQSQHQVALLAKEYQELAKQMGVTTEEVARGAVEFYRQGLTQEEVMERMRVTTMAAKISAQDFRTTAELLTAAVNSMNVSIERASDVFAYLGKVYCPFAA